MFDIDTTLFFLFLMMTLGVGLWYSRGSQGLQAYAVEDRSFPTTVLAMSIVATSLSGSMLAVTLKAIYENGFWGIVA